MPTYHTYNVIPTLPAALEPLREMVFNLWWTWEPSARRLFRHLDPELWNRTNHNPVRMLQLSRQARLVEVAQDKSFLRELKEVHDAFRHYLARERHLRKNRPGQRDREAGRLFFRRVRLSRIDSELLRRPRHSRRRSLQVGQRSRSEFRRDRIALPARLLQTADRQGRRPARRQPEPEFSSSADPGSAERRQQSAHFRPAPRPRGVGEDLGTARRAHQPLTCSIPISRRTPRKIVSSRPSFTAAISKCGSGRRSSSASAA